MPFEDAGLALLTAAINAVRFSLSASVGNDARPMVHWTIPANQVERDPL